VATAAEEQQDDGGEMVLLTFRVPRSWRTALTEAAKVQRISVADLLRIILRGFLRERYKADERRELGVD
jgi:hypothetical protein